MKQNEKVKWVSQAKGHVREKSGVIVQVVPPGERPDKERFPDLYRGGGIGFARDHESYVVKVDKKHYWPRVSALQLVLTRGITVDLNNVFMQAGECAKQGCEIHGPGHAVMLLELGRHLRDMRDRYRRGDAGIIDQFFDVYLLE